MYEEKEELVTIMKLAAKERLQLERQLAIAKPGPVSFFFACTSDKEIRIFARVRNFYLTPVI